MGCLSFRKTIKHLLSGVRTTLRHRTKNISNLWCKLDGYERSSVKMGGNTSICSCFSKHFFFFPLGLLFSKNPLFRLCFTSIFYWKCNLNSRRVISEGESCFLLSKISLSSRNTLTLIRPFSSTKEGQMSELIKREGNTHAIFLVPF